MVIDTKIHRLESPSMSLAYQFWELAKEEYSSRIMVQQKDGCEKAYRAATEAIDTLLAFHGIVIVAGQAQTHIDRSDELERLTEIDSRIRSISQRYAEIIHKLHGICFYSPANPQLYKTVFDSVEKFLKDIEKLLNE